MLALPPLSVYVHIPWCVRKCPYCDFNSHTYQDSLPERDYFSALARDLANELPYVQGRKITSVFFGGGTPSLLSARTIGDILQLLDREIGFVEGVEITLEASPGTTEQKRFLDYYAAGVNRLSVGVQSFHAAQLQHLGRIHSGEDARRAVQMAMDAGFQHINIDLMHGLPEQTEAQALADLRLATQLGVDHISWYQLTIEPNTVFYSQPPVLPLEDDLAAIQASGAQWLKACGYAQYEVSAFARPGGQCQHNLNYWQFGDYLGIGAGAHGKFTDLASAELGRRRKTRQPEHYLTALDPLAGMELIAGEQQFFEFSMNVLRLVGGVAGELFSQRTGQPMPWQLLTPLVDQGLLCAGSKRFAATELGFQFLNETLTKIDLATER